MNKILKFLKQRRIYASWLLSYFLILVVFIFMSSIFYSKSHDVIKNEINKNNLMTLEKVREDIDEGVESAKTLDSQLAVNGSVNMYVKKQSDNIYYQKSMNTYSLLNEIKKYRGPNKWMENFYIIYHRKQECITPSGSWSMKNFYDFSVTRDKFISQEVWDYLNNGESKSGFIVLNPVKGNEKNNCIAYVSTLPFSGEENVEITIVVTIQNQFIQDAFKVYGEHSAFIVDENNSVFISNGINPEFQNVKYDELEDGKNELYLKNNSRGVVYSYIKSNKSNLKYVVAMSIEDYERDLLKLKNFSVLCAIIACLIGMGISLYVSFRSYRPVSEIMKILPDTYSENKNEFGIIKNTIDGILNEKKRYMDSIYEQKKQLMYFFVADVVKGIIQDENIIEKGFNTYSLKKLSDMYGVIIIYVEDMGDVIYDKNNKDRNSEFEAWNNVQFIIKNIGEELISEKNMGLVVNVEGIMCCFVNFNSDDAESAEADMKEIAEKMQTVLSEHFHIITTVSIGEAQEGYIGISLSYKQAFESLEYRMLEIENKVINYKDIIASKNQGFYKYDLVVENELIKNIKVGNFEAASKIIEELFAQNFEKKNISRRMAKLFKMELFSTIIKVMYEINSSYQNEFADKAQLVEELLKNDNIDETLNQLLEVIKEVCDYINDNKKSHNDNLSKKIMDQISANLYDPNLSSQNIAEYFGITGNYLLRFFKEQMGTGLFDYIHSERIKKAKELLVETDMRINDIAESVGYCSTNTFIRIFKKVEGIPPGQYRKNKEQLE